MTWKNNLKSTIENNMQSLLSHKIDTSKAKNILFYSPVPWNQGNLERMWALALKVRGHNVTEIICGGGFKACGMEHVDVPRPKCDKCRMSAISWFEIWQSEYTFINQYIDSHIIEIANKATDSVDIAELLNMNYFNCLKYTFEGLPIGKRVYEKVYWYFNGYFDDRETVAEYIRKCYHSYIVTALATKKLLQSSSVDCVIACNGKTIEVGPLQDAALQYGIDVVTWEEMFNFDWITPAFELKYMDIWNEYICKEEMSYEQLDRCKKWIDDNKQGKTQLVQYYQNPIESKNLICDELKIDKNKYTMLCLGNLVRESNVIGMHKAFRSMYDWVDFCVQYAIDNYNVNLIVRAHPVELDPTLYYKTKLPLCDYIRNKYSNLPDNIILIDPTSQISSYGLLEIADFAMTYTSTLCLEAPFYGFKLAVIGDMHYSGKGFTIDIDTKDDLLYYLDHKIKSNFISESEKKLAYKYLDFYMFRIKTELNFYNYSKGCSFEISDLNFLLPGEDVFWDNLCESLICDYAFIDLNFKNRKKYSIKEKKELLKNNIMKLYSNSQDKPKSLSVNCDNDNINRNSDSMISKSKFETLDLSMLNYIPSGDLEGELFYYEDNIDIAGFKIYYDSQPTVQTEIRNIFEQKIYDLKTKKERPIVIDGGAHLGLFSLYIKKLYPNAKIIAFEPDELSYKLLLKNIHQNNFSDITCIKNGLYNQDTLLKFSSDGADGSSINSNGCQEINVCKLSSFMNEEIDYLKLNIEGAELEVLQEIEHKLYLVNEICIEYHGFPEIGQRLHFILEILDRNGFRYMIHDFDKQTNPATKPPFKLQKETRFFLLIYAKRIMPSHYEQNSADLQPLSRKFGFDRGTPIDRIFMDYFLSQNSKDIHGNVLEIAEDTYTKKFGQDVKKIDILHVDKNSSATIIGNLETGANIPENRFDCIVLMQTLHVIYNYQEVIKNCYKALKDNGVLLLTAPGISQISRYDMDRWGDYWRFTNLSLKKVLGEIFSNENVDVENYGNYKLAAEYLNGRAAEEIPESDFAYIDDDYQLLLGAKAIKNKKATDMLYNTSVKIDTDNTAKALILLYHRVAEDRLNSQLLAVSPQNFEDHLKYLKTNFRIVSLQILTEEFSNNQLKPNSIALTFDDGYLDNLTNALPLLEKYQIPATIFITTDFIGKNEEFWWDELERIFLCEKNIPPFLSITDDVKGVQEWDLSILDGRIKAWNDLQSYLRSQSYVEIRSFMDDLVNNWMLNGFNVRSSHKAMNIEQLKKLAASPFIEIGSHTLSHTMLSSLLYDDQMKEICESKGKLEMIIGKQVKFISYPFGSNNDFNEISKSICKKCGYIAAIANIQDGIKLSSDLFAMPRRLVRDWNGTEFANWMSSSDKYSLETKTVQNRQTVFRKYWENQ